MNKIKQFFKKIAIWFKSHNLIIEKIFIFIFGLYFGVISCLLSGHSLIEVNTASAKTIDTYNRQIINNYYVLNDNELKFDLGLQNQVLLSSASQTDYNYASRQITASLPISFCIDTTFSSASNTSVVYDIKMGSVLHELPNNDTYYITNEASTHIIESFEFSGQVDKFLNFGNSVTQFVNGNYLSMNNGIFIKFTNYIGDANNGYNVFGFEFPTYLRVNSNNTATSTFSSWNYVNYFYFNTNIDIVRNSGNYVAPTKVVSYTLSYEDFSNYQAVANESIYMPYFKCHSILLDNGVVFSFGMPYLVRYVPSSYEVGLTNTVYIMEDSLDEATYNTAYNSGYSSGWVDASNERLSNLTPFSFVVNSVSSFFDIKLFGDVSIGVVISLCFGVLLIGIIIKTFLGG